MKMPFRMRTDTIKPTPHSLDDIRVVRVMIEEKKVDQNGLVVGQPTLRGQLRREWRCQRCQLAFHQWPMVLAHIGQEQPGSKPEELMVFAREVLGMTITDQQAKVVSDIVNNPQARSLQRFGRRWGQTVGTHIAQEFNNKGIRGNNGDVIILHED